MIEMITALGVPKQYAGDVWLLVLFLAASIFLLVLVNRNSLGSFLLAIYVAYALLRRSGFEFLEDPNILLLYFGGVMILVFVILKNAVRIGVGGGTRVLKISLIAISAVGLLGTVVMEWSSSQTIMEFFSPFSYSLLGSEEARLAWMVFPLILLYALCYRKN